MTLQDLTVGPEAVTLHWTDGAQCAIPPIWLRDSDPAGFHPATGERVLDLLALPDVPEIAEARVEDGGARLTWRDGHVSRFSGAWFARHRPGRPLPDPAAVAPAVWGGNGPAGGVPRHQAGAILSDDAALAAWLHDLCATGLTIVEGVGVDADPDAGIAIAEHVGFLRETNFGRVFEVFSKPEPNNLAYTSDALPLHTDLANQEVPPGYQFLHCLANEVRGGGSVFADGYGIAEDLRAADPAAFALLSGVAIPFRFHDREVDIRVHRPVIGVAPDGGLTEIRYNAHLADIFDMPPEGLAAYYRAYRAFMAGTRRADRQLTLKLRAGEMAVFDNRRVLHGREAFDPATGKRHLRGCYVDRGEVDSRLRRLAVRG
jgi:gamma-butyrobetaine dioxygenase